MKWLTEEWQTQWPLIRFELYKWGFLGAGSLVIALGAKLLHSLLKAYDTYFYIVLFLLACACFVFLSSRMSKLQGGATTPAKQKSTEALVPLATPIPPTVQQMNDFYNSLDVLFTREVEAAIYAEIDRIPASNERDAFVRQALVSTAVSYWLEQAWYNIFGSQIKALELLNTRMVKRDELLQFYAAAAAGWPQAYSQYNFDEWIGWMRTVALITERADQVGISVKGHAFLDYMVMTQRSADQREY